MVKWYELLPWFDRQKSFYGKARVKTGGASGAPRLTLYSYGTPVCWIDCEVDQRALLANESAAGMPATRKRKFHRAWGDWSRTTARHVNEFRRQAGFRPMPKKEWDSLPVEQPR